MKFKLLGNASLKIFLFATSLIWFFFYFQTIDVPLQGTHQWRQADTLFSAYFFCTESSDILRPKIGPRQNTGGVAIGEFPFYSWVVGQWCRIKGSWDEVSPKIVNLIFYVLAMWSWWIFLRDYFQLKAVKWFHWAGLSFFSMISLSFLTIPMPEATALLFFGVAGMFWTGVRGVWPVGAGIAAFSFGFLLRPYHIPFLVLFRPRWKIFAITLMICVLLFGVWYKYWPTQATEMWGYYGIQFESFEKLLQALPKALAVLPTRILDHTHWLGLLLFYPVWKRKPLLILLYVGSIGMMVVLKATHLPYHAYYLINSAVLALVIMVYGLETLTAEWKRNLFLILFVLYGVGNTFHNIHGDATRREAEQLGALAATIPADAQVATYTGTPQTLYWLKRTGWQMLPRDFQSEFSCPEGADYYLMKASEENYKLGKCEHAK